MNVPAVFIIATAIFVYVVHEAGPMMRQAANEELEGMKWMMF